MLALGLLLLILLRKIIIMNKYIFSAGLLVWMALSFVCTYLLLGPDIFRNTNFFYAFFVTLALNYYILAFLFGWRMPTITLTLIKGTHDIQRLLLFVFFCFLWVSAFLSNIVEKGGGTVT